MRTFVTGVGEVAFHTCPTCMMWHGIPIEIETAARARKGVMSIYCPNGHSWYFTAGESSETLLRRERDRLKQQLAEKEDAIRAERERADRRVLYEREQKEAAQRQAAARKGVVTRMKSRAAAGLCPCCNRTFENLHKHMGTKHPGYKAEEVA